MIDRSGSLKAKEFGRVCYDMGLFLDQTEVEAAMHIVDTERNGYDDERLSSERGEKKRIGGGNERFSSTRCQNLETRFISLSARGPEILHNQNSLLITLFLPSF